MSNPNPPAIPGPAPSWLRWIGGIALAAYILWLGLNFSIVAGGADSSGYLNSARLLASGSLAAELRVPAEFGPPEQLRRQQFQPHGFVPFDGNPRLSPTYPVGLPLHFALTGKLFGWTAGPLLTGLGAAAGALLLTFAVARRFGVSPLLAAAGAAILGAYPVFFFTSIQPLSDTLATTWCLAAVWAALRARDHPGWALGCGVALAVAVLVRATNAVLLPALVVLLGFNVRRLALAVLGGLPGALWLGYYNHTLYGGAFRSGYVDIAQAFGWAYGPPTVVHFAKWLALLLPAALLLLPFKAVAAPLGRGRELLALALWFGAFAGLYAFYEISHEVWWDLRFILPGTPALIIAALIGLERVAQARPLIATRVRAGAAIGLVVWAAALGVYWTDRFHLRLTKTYEQAYADAAAAARQQFPPDTLVLAGLHSGALYYYTTFPVLRWEFVSADEFARFLAQLQSTGRTVAAVLHKVEDQEALQKKCPGAWTRVQTIKDVSLWRLDRAAPAVTQP